MMLVARPDSIVFLTQSLLDFDYPALTFRMHPPPGTIVPEHPPVGSDLLALDLHESSRSKRNCRNSVTIITASSLGVSVDFFISITSVSAAHIARPRHGP